MIVRLCDEHAQMQKSLCKIAAEGSPSDPWATREAAQALLGIEP